MKPGARTKAEDHPCANCGDPTPGNFCPTCGQRKADIRVAVWTMVRDVLEDQLFLNRKLPRTLRALLFRPGFLTHEHAAGRIVRYVQPFRLYLGASVLFFLLLSVVSRGVGPGEALVGPGESGPDASAGTAAADTATATAADTVTATSTERLDIQISRTGIAPLDSALQARRRQLVRLDAGEALRRILTELIATIPTTMFVLLPLFALILKGLYVGTGRYYAEHFVFSLHLHAFLFVLFTLILIAVRAGLPWVPAPLSLWTLLYAFVAMKRVYGQGWLLTTAKYVVLGFVYLFVLAVGLTITVTVAILQA